MMNLTAVSICSIINWGSVVIRRVRPSGFENIAGPKQSVKSVDQPVGLLRSHDKISRIDLAEVKEAVEVAESGQEPVNLERVDGRGKPLQEDCVRRPGHENVSLMIEKLSLVWIDMVGSRCLRFAAHRTTTLTPVAIGYPRIGVVFGSSSKHGRSNLISEITSCWCP